jgi:hypothetical protein
MPGIETNIYQLTCLVAHIKTEALKRPAASCSWISPGGSHQAGLMGYVIPSHMGDEPTYIRSVCPEPSVVKEMKPYRTNYQQKESSCKRQIENNDRSHVPFLSGFARSKQRVWILMKHQRKKTNKAQLGMLHYNVFLRLWEEIGMRREGHVLQKVWFKGKWGFATQPSLLRLVNNIASKDQTTEPMT